jgi:hypothetical protein
MPNQPGSLAMAGRASPAAGQVTGMQLDRKERGAYFGPAETGPAKGVFMNRRLLAALAVAAIAGMCVPLLAHHGNAAYDMTRVEMKGVTVKQFLWANPHCIVVFDVKDASGKVTQWSAELGSPSAISLVGFTRDSLKPSDVVDIDITVSKTGNPVGRIREIKFPDGSILPREPEGGRGAAQ